MHARTGKFLNTTISFLDDADLDVDVAVAKFNEVTREDWAIIMDEMRRRGDVPRSADRLGNYTPNKKGSSAKKAIKLAVSRLHRLMWTKASQQQKQPYEDELEEWLTERKRERDVWERDLAREKERVAVLKASARAQHVARDARWSSDEAAKSASEVVAKVAGDAATAALDKEFGPNTTVYNAGGHDLTASRTLARLDSLIWAVRNSSLMAQRFSKLT